MATLHGDSSNLPAVAAGISWLVALLPSESIKPTHITNTGVTIRFTLIDWVKIMTIMGTSSDATAISQSPV